MRIKHVAYQGVKGQSGRHDLAPVQIFVGPNGAGKSSIGEALRLLLVGWTAKTGKTPGGVFERRGTASKVHVEGRDTEERTHWRTWEKVGRSVGCQSSQGIPETPPVMLDFGTFLSMTTRARTAYLFSLIDPADMQMDAPALTAAVKGIRLDPHPPEAEAAITTLVKIIDGVVHEKPEQQDFIRLVIEQMRSALSDETANHKRLQQTADGLLAAAGDEAAAPRANIDVLVRESAARHDMSNANINSKSQALKEWTEAMRRHNQIVSKAATAPDIGPVVEKLRLEVANLEAALEKARQAGVEYAQTTPRSTFLNELEEASDKAGQIANSYSMLSANVAGFEAAVAASAEAITNAKSHTACPFCKSSGEGWMTSLLDSLGGKLKEDQERLSDALKQKSDLKVRYDEARQAEKELESKRASVEKEFDRLSSEYNTAARLLADRKLELSQHETEMARWAQVRSDASASTPPPGTEDELRQAVAEAVRVRDANQLEHDALLAEQREAIGRRAKDGQRQKAVEEAAKAKVAVAVIKQAVAVMEERQDDILKRTVGGFILRAQALTGSILPSPLEFKDGEIGRLQDGVWIGLADFSRGEEMLAFGALSAALAFEAPFRCVIFDDLGVIDPANKVTLIQRMSALVQDGWCDQFVAFDVSRAGIIGDCAVKEI